MKYKYPKAIKTPAQRKIYRSLKRRIKSLKEDRERFYGWYSNERDNYNDLKQKVINIANF